MKRVYSSERIVMGLKIKYLIDFLPDAQSFHHSIKQWMIPQAITIYLHPSLS